jgi:diguanylate cyclase
VSDPPPPTPSEAAHAITDLALKQKEVEDARAALSRLHRDLPAAEERVVLAHAALLVAANEQLVVATMRARTDAAQSTKELKEMMLSNGLDTLTELPNRALLLDRFRQAIANARRNDTSLAVLFLDLDNFKEINDTLGHAVGDDALRAVARGLVSAIRAGDTVSRHGGDEFLILLAGMSHASDAVVVAEKIIAVLARPALLGGHLICLTASIGISVFPDDANDAETLIELADASMYLAKKRGLGRFVVHGQQPRGVRSSRPPVLKRKSDG